MKRYIILFFYICSLSFLYGKDQEILEFRAKGIGMAERLELDEWKNSRRIALIIGVNEYKSLAHLFFANNDSLKMKLALEQVGKFNEIILMNDETGKENPKLLPTKKNIVSTYNRIIKEKPDLLLFYFSGHGFMAQNGENVIAPINAIYDSKEIKNAISISQLAKEAKKVPKAMFFIDACREKIVEGRKSLSGKIFGNFPDEVLNAKGVAIMMSTKPGGYSYEVRDLGGGLFTYYLVKGISGGVQDLGPEYVTFDALKTYTEQNIRNYAKNLKGKEQVPYTAGDYTGNFLIAVGRPDKDIHSEIVKYQNDNKVIRYSRILFDTYNRRLSQNFFTYGSGKKYLLSDLNGVSRMSYEYGENKFLAKQFNTKGDLVFTYGVIPFENNTYEIRIFDNNKSIEHFYDKNTVRLKEYTENNKKVKTIYKHIEIKQEKEYTLKIETFKDSSGKITTSQEGISIIEMKYNPSDFLMRKEFYNANHKPIENSKGIAKYIYEYNAFGKKISEQYLDARGKPARNKFGISKYEYLYDDNGNKLIEAFYNEEGKPVEKYGVAKITYKYNSKNKPLEIRYLDINGELKENGAGVALVNYVYTNNKETIEYRNKNQELLPYGIAQKNIEYDESGNILEQEYKNSAGKLINEPYYGIARIVYRYNEKKQKLREIYYNSENYQSNNIYGISEIDFVYNTNGQVQKKINKNKRGNTVNDINNIAFIEYTYDDNSRVIKEESFSADNKLKDNEFGIAKILFTYDTDSNLVAKEFFNSKNISINDPEGIAKYKYSYDNAGRLTLEEHITDKDILLQAKYFSYIQVPGSDKIIKLSLDKFYRPVKYQFLSKRKRK